MPQWQTQIANPTSNNIINYFYTCGPLRTEYYVSLPLGLPLGLPLERGVCHWGRGYATGDGRMPLGAWACQRVAMPRLRHKEETSEAGE